MRLRLLAALVLLAAFVNGEKMTWRNDEGNTCAVYYRFKRAMCDCGDQWSTNNMVSITMLFIISFYIKFMH